MTFGSDNNVWKLGDIVNSTPRIVASVPLNKYDTVYNDTTYKSFIDNTAYKNRGMVFTGGNDGMLHAFKLGKLELSGGWKTGQRKPEGPISAGRLSGTSRGHSSRRTPFRTLNTSKDPDYCHLYYTDLAPYVFDASIGVGTTDQSRRLGPGQLANGAHRRDADRGGMREYLRDAGLREDSGHGQGASLRISPST